MNNEALNNGRLGLSREQSLFLCQIVTAGSVKTVTASEHSARGANVVHASIIQSILCMNMNITETEI